MNNTENFLIIKKQLIKYIDNINKINFEEFINIFKEPYGTFTCDTLEFWETNILNNDEYCFYICQRLRNIIYYIICIYIYLNNMNNTVKHFKNIKYILNLIIDKFINNRINNYSQEILFEDDIDEEHIKYNSQEDLINKLNHELKFNCIDEIYKLNNINLDNLNTLKIKTLSYWVIFTNYQSLNIDFINDEYIECLIMIYEYYILYHDYNHQELSDILIMITKDYYENYITDTFNDYFFNY